MTSKLRKILLIAMTAMFGVCFLTACSFGTSVDREKEIYGLTASITYHANGGTFGSKNPQASIYYKEGAYALDVGKNTPNSGTIEISKDGYDLVGWFYPKTDDGGNVIYADEENGIVELGDEFDFGDPLEKGEELNLYAKWLRKITLEVCLASEESISNKLVYGDKTYQVGDLLSEYKFESNGAVSRPGLDPLTGSKDSPENYVRAEFYADKECTRVLEWPVYQGDADENIKVYLKYLSDEWTIIEKNTDVQKMFSEGLSGKYFVKNNITAQKYDSAIAVKPNAQFKGAIRGNGYTLEGFKFESTDLDNNDVVSIFGSVSAQASISDLTMKNWSVEYRVKDPGTSLNVYFLASSIDANSRISGLKIDGGSITVRLRVSGKVNGLDVNNKDEIELPSYGGDAIEGITVINPIDKAEIKVSQK